jgi:DNA segregation ATPase FtsK/SpoIIIE-like protein
MDQLEKMVIVGPPAGAKPREVLCSTVDEINSHIANAM